jgi:hypothetical protein
MLEYRRNYESKLEAQLAQWKADIDVLAAKANRAGVDVKVQADEAVDALRAKHLEATKHLQELHEATDDAWGGLKAATEKAWSDLTAVFTKSA